MYIKKVLLKNFRNYCSEEFCFINGVNILYGDNGQGKTNVLEALFLASMGKSFRTSHDTEMIREGCDFLELQLYAEEEIDIKVTYNKQKQKSIRLNGIYLRKMGDLMGALPCVIFSPTNMMLLSAGPSERRKFIDMALCQLKPIYYFDLQQYNKILMQKNALLREYNGNSSVRETLEVWNLSLAQYGSKVTEQRIAYLHQIQKEAVLYHEKISGRSEQIEIKYSSSGSSDSHLFYKKITEAAEREIERKMSLVGPHKDDVEFILKNTGDIKKYGSQGQKRTCVLALKLAETKILKEANGKMPILLLDDVLSELDTKRQEMLLSSIENSQVFITCTDCEKLKNAPERTTKSFCIKNGKVVI